MAAGGIPISFSYTVASECDLNSIEVIRSDASDVPVGGGAASVTPDAHGDAKIRIHSSFSSSEENWKALAAHEVGHLLDFNHADTGCGAYSIMIAIGFTWSGLKCGDSAALFVRWPWEDTESWEPSEFEEDCWDVYIVRITLCEGAGGYYQCGYQKFFQRTDCGVPI